MNLKNLPKNKLKLAGYTTIGIGGMAKEFFLAASLQELKEVVRRYKFDFYLLGGGSNLLVADHALSKPVVKLCGEFDFIDSVGMDLEAGAAAPFARLIKYCEKMRLGGLENLAGIPATVGGMLVMNASAYQRAISDCLTAVEIFDRKKKARWLKREKIDFAYRDSSLIGSIVLRARFKLREDRFIKEKAADFIKERCAKQDYSAPSCGCIFKNPQGFSAGYLIDSCGLKGTRKNDAQISLKHANFIINLGKAACKDVEYLIHKAKEAVNKKFNIILEEEVVRWS